MQWLSKSVATLIRKRHDIHFSLLYKIGVWCIFILFILHYYCQGISSDSNSGSIYPADYSTHVVIRQPNYSTFAMIKNSVVSVTKCNQELGKVVFRKVAYPQYPECRNFTKCLYENNSFEQTPLVSFPGSGNTWTRHLIELASGIFTGSIYMDVDLISRGFVGEKEPPYAGSTIVQKMHIHFSKELNVTRAVLLIRDPYKAIVSFVHYLESGHLGLAFSQTFKKKEWPAYILGKTYEWISVAKSWIEAPVHLLILHYELLQGKERVKELERVCNFLQISCHNLHTTCFQNHNEGFFHRRRKSVIQPAFPDWVRKKVNGGINYLNTLLIQHGHSQLPLHKYQHQIY